MSLDRKILDRIEKENLSIRPKWFFAVKNLVFGVGTFSASILGSLSLALLFEIMANQGKNLTWLTVPYLYLMLLGVFLLGGYWLVTRVDSLYKLKFVPILTVLFFFSLSFGYLTFASGKAGRIERELEEVPIYAKIVPVDREIPLETYRRHRCHHQRENDEESRRDDRDGDRHWDKNRRSDNNKNDETAKEESGRRFDLKNENREEEIKAFEKTHSVDADAEDSVKSEVKGASTKSVSDETVKTTDVADEKSDSSKDTMSSSKDTSDENDSDTVDASSDEE